MSNTIYIYGVSSSVRKSSYYLQNRTTLSCVLRSSWKVGNLIHKVSNRSLSCVEVVNYFLAQALQNQGMLCSREKSLKWLFYNRNEMCMYLKDHVVG